MQETLGIKVYTPSLLGDGGYPLAVVHGMERALPGLHLGWTVSEERHLVALAQRDEWLSQQEADGRFPFVCNCDESYPVMVSGIEIPVNIGPGRQPLFDVHAELPLDAAVLAAAADLLEAVAEGAHALWGHATPFNASAEISRQTDHPVVLEPQRPPRGLPVLKHPGQISSREIPHRLGWLNYWSAASAQAIGFPDPARDAQLLSRARRTATGGWVVQLTDTPLDLENPAHLQALLLTYERFPVIGGRVTAR